jgi:hypothetical protein
MPSYLPLTPKIICDKKGFSQEEPFLLFLIRDLGRDVEILVKDKPKSLSLARTQVVSS